VLVLWHLRGGDLTSASTLALLRSLVISASISDRPEAGEIFLPTVDYHDPSWN